jgi:hypothetical protein
LWEMDPWTFMANHPTKPLQDAGKQPTSSWVLTAQTVLEPRWSRTKFSLHRMESRMNSFHRMKSEEYIHSTQWWLRDWRLPDLLLVIITYTLDLASRDWLSIFFFFLLLHNLYTSDLRMRNVSLFSMFRLGGTNSKEFIKLQRLFICPELAYLLKVLWRNVVIGVSCCCSW